MLVLVVGSLFASIVISHISVSHGWGGKKKINERCIFYLFIYISSKYVNIFPYHPTKLKIIVPPSVLFH